MGLLKVGLWLKPKVEHEFLFDSPGMDLLVDYLISSSPLRISFIDFKSYDLERA